MTPIVQVLAFIGDAAVLGTYWAMVRFGTQRWTDRFNLANALGWPPVVAIEIAAGAWAALPLTVVFGAIGVWGTVKWFKRTWKTRSS